MKKPSFEYVQQILRYDPKTGLLYWKARTPDMFPPNSFHPAERICRGWNTQYAGTIAGTFEKRQGYLRVWIIDRHYYAHRVAWLLYHGEWPKKDIDHRNGMKTQNQIQNLREVSETLNAANKVKNKLNKSGYTGVYLSRGRWHAAFRFAGKKTYVGSFSSKESAAEAIRKARASHGGFTERHGEDKLVYDL